jgi:hypothetical protein
MLNPIQWAWQKGKGHICVDSTNGTNSPDKPGSPNTNIPKLLMENTDECPPAYYMMAFAHVLVNISDIYSLFFFSSISFSMLMALMQLFGGSYIIQK